MTRVGRYDGPVMVISGGGGGGGLREVEQKGTGVEHTTSVIVWLMIWE